MVFRVERIGHRAERIGHRAERIGHGAEGIVHSVKEKNRLWVARYGLRVAGCGLCVGCCEVRDITFRASGKQKELNKFIG
jgi:hypothetical protein